MSRTPLREDIRGLLVTEEEIVFSNNILCLGYKTEKGKLQRCSSYASNKHGPDVAILVTKLSEFKDLPHEDGFYNDVKRLIELLHCAPQSNWKKESHAAAALRNFEAWRHQRTIAHLPAPRTVEASADDEARVKIDEEADDPLSQPVPAGPPGTLGKRGIEEETDSSLSQSAPANRPGKLTEVNLSADAPILENGVLDNKPASQTLESPATDEAQADVEPAADGPSPQLGTVTPAKKPSRRNAFPERVTSEPVSPGESGLSPGEESIFDLTQVSSASTNVTTPGSLLESGQPRPNTAATSFFSGNPRNFSTLVEKADEERPSTPALDEDVDNHGDDDNDERLGTPMHRPKPRYHNQYAQSGPLGTIHIPKFPSTGKDRHKNLIKSILKPFNKEESYVGIVYIWRHKGPNTKPTTPITKVGWTRTTVAGRRKQPGCYKGRADDFWYSPVPFVGAKRVEQTAHKHLAECNIRLKICNECSKGHFEWFERDAAEVKELVEAWIKFTLVAYVNGKITEVARHAVQDGEWIVDMRPDVAGLASYLEAKAKAAAEDKESVSLPQASGRVVTAEHGLPDEVVVNNGSDATITVDEKNHTITITAEPGTLSVDAVLAPPSHPPPPAVPPKPTDTATAVPDKPKPKKRRTRHLSRVAQAVRHHFSGDGQQDKQQRKEAGEETMSTRQSSLLEAAQAGGSSSHQQQRPPASIHSEKDNSNNNKFKQAKDKFFESLALRPRSEAQPLSGDTRQSPEGKEEMRTVAHDDERGGVLRDRAMSWMPMPRRARTFAV